VSGLDCNDAAWLRLMDRPHRPHPSSPVAWQQWPGSKLKERMGRVEREPGIDL
jgi:hypothetical protein